MKPDYKAKTETWRGARWVVIRDHAKSKRGRVVARYAWKQKLGKQRWGRIYDFQREQYKIRGAVPPVDKKRHYDPHYIDRELKKPVPREKPRKFKVVIMVRHQTTTKKNEKREFNVRVKADIWSTSSLIADYRARALFKAVVGGIGDTFQNLDSLEQGAGYELTETDQTSLSDAHPSTEIRETYWKTESSRGSVPSLENELKEGIKKRYHWTVNL